MVEVADGEVALHQEHVLEQRAGGVRPVGHPLVQGAVRHVPQEDHGLLHDGQCLLGPQVGLLKVTWNIAIKDGAQLKMESECLVTVLILLLKLAINILRCVFYVSNFKCLHRQKRPACTINMREFLLILPMASLATLQ